MGKQTTKMPRALGRAKLVSPYHSLDNALGVARVLHENGGGPCSADQLLSFLGYKSIRSGMYQMRTSAARQFGLIQNSRDNISVTQLAEDILNPFLPEQATSARRDAFLNVELYKNIYNRFKGRALPPEKGLHNFLRQEYHLTENRVGPATRIFLASADQAGFLKESGGAFRLVEPVISASVQVNAGEPKVSAKVDAKAEEAGASPALIGTHKAIIGLLEELPEPKSAWPLEEKEAFKKAFLTTLDLIYPTQGEKLKEEN